MLSLTFNQVIKFHLNDWRAVPQQPQKLLVAKLRPRNQKESEAQAILLMSSRSRHCVSRLKQEALHEQKQEVPSEIPVRAPT